MEAGAPVFLLRDSEAYFGYVAHVEPDGALRVDQLHDAHINEGRPTVVEPELRALAGWSATCQPMPKNIYGDAYIATHIMIKKPGDGFCVRPGPWRVRRALSAFVAGEKL